MNNIEKYIHGLDDETIHSIISSYEEYDLLGKIGDEPIRIHTEIIMTTMGIPQSLITQWFRHLVFECYRYFYNKSL